MGEHGPLRTDTDGGVVVVTIDHPPSNLVDGALVMGLLGLLDEVEPDESAKVLLFKSADPDFFLMHGDVELRCPVGLLAPQFVPDRQLVERGHRDSRTDTAAPWAGRSSAAERASTCGATSASASAVYSTRCTPLRNDCTDSPDACRAVQPVGRT